MIKTKLFFLLFFIILFNCCTQSDGNQFNQPEKDYLKRYFIESLENNNTKKENLYGMQKNGSYNYLKKLLNGEEKLIIEYSPLSCSLCVDSLFTYINDSKLNKKLIVISGANNKNEVTIEINKYSLDAEVLIVNLTTKIVEELNHDPKMYYLDSEMNISHFISINKLSTKYLKNYIKILEKK